VKHIATKAISAICNDVVHKLPFIERKLEINIGAESYKTPEQKSACRDSEKEARDLDFLTQLRSEDCATPSELSSEEILSHSPPGSPDSHKTLTMEDVSTNGEELFSPTQASTTKEVLYSDFDPKAKEPKVAGVITPKFSDTKKPPLLCLMGTPFSSLLLLRRSAVVSNHRSRL
jgi:hypothetical protein